MAAGVVRQSNHRCENVFFSCMAAVILAYVFVGFAKSYYLAGIFNAPLPSLLVHIHGAVFSCWILLLIAQISLVSAGRVNVHRRLGLLGFGLACLIVVLGTAVVTQSIVRHATDSAIAEVRALYALGLADMLMFATFVFFAFRNRFNPAVHKRLILLATFAILVAAYDGWPVNVPWWTHGVTPVICIYPLLLLLMVYDWWSTRKVQPVTIWGSAFLVLVLQSRVLIGNTTLWQSFAGWVQAHAASFPLGPA
jgi:hypothetical protein